MPRSRGRIPIKMNGLKENADGLYLLSELEQRLSQAIEAYENLKSVTTGTLTILIESCN